MSLVHYFFNNFTDIRQDRNRSIVITKSPDSVLKIGMTFAVLHMLGKQPVAKDLFMSSGRGIEIISLIKCRFSVGIQFDPTHLLLFIEFIMFLILWGVVGDIKKVLGFGCFE